MPNTLKSIQACMRPGRESHSNALLLAVVVLLHNPISKLSRPSYLILVSPLSPIGLVYQ